MAQKAEKIFPKILNRLVWNAQISPRDQKWPKFISQTESLKYRVKRFGSNILIRIWVPLESSFLISVPD